jgi:hypothetical protein
MDDWQWRKELTPLRAPEPDAVAYKPVSIDVSEVVTIPSARRVHGARAHHDGRVAN